MIKLKNLVLPAVILVVSGFLHLVWLDRPHSVVFDEVHFGKFVNSYCCTGKRFFDIHPPHAKLLLAASAKLGGYDGAFAFKKIGDDYKSVPVFALRIVPALAGTLLSLLFFILLKQFGASRPAAFLGALFLTLDNALLVQTRVMAIDGILLVAIVSALSLFLAAGNHKTGKWRYLLLLLCGSAAGLAVGTKFTGLTALALPGVIVAATILKNRDLRTVLCESRDYLLIVVGTAAVYLIGWYLHFALLPMPGPGDAYLKLHGSFLTDISKFHETMLRYNYFLGATHHDASRWWSWPLMTTPIFYWTGPKAGIYFLGNPVVWWGGSLAFLASLIMSVRRILRRLIKKTAGQNFLFYVPVAGFLIAYLPYIPVPRVLFMYHYLPPLLFSLLFTTLFLDRSGWIMDGGLTEQRWSYWGTIVLLIAGFIVISPLTFGWQYPEWYDRMIFGAFPGWR
ncbi:MAG: phospholipid carrier-dependent glycosyltransferase [Nitrospinales bacterium]